MLRRLLTRFRQLGQPPRRAKLAKRAGIAVAGTYAVYLIGVNAYLGAHGLSLPEAVHVTYASAWTWYPGQIQARGVRVVGTDSHVEWQLDVDQVHCHVSIVDLAFHRKFHASAVRGSGVSMRLRRKLPAAELTPEVLAALPPIDGVTAPPIAPATPSPPISDADYDLWSVQIDDAQATDLRELWFDAYHFSGQANVAGSFALRPVRMARVGPAAVDVFRGELRIGGEVALDQLTGHLETTIAPFDPREDATNVVHALTTTAKGDGRLAGLAFLKQYGIGAPAIALDGGTGPVHVDLRIDHGLLTSPSTLTVDTEHVGAKALDHRAATAAHLGLVVEKAGERDEAHFTIGLAQLAAWHGNASEPVLRAAHASATAKSANLDLVQPFQDATIAAALPDVVFPDLRRLDAYLGKDATTLRGGVAHAHGTFHASLVTRHAAGRLGVAGDDVTVHTDRTDVHGKATADVVLADLDLDSHHADLSDSRLELRDIVLSRAPSQPPWWANVELVGARTSFTPFHFRTKLALQAKDGRPLLEQALPAWMANLIGLEDLRGEAKVALGASDVDVTGFHIQGKGGDVRGELHQHGASTRGLALAHAGLLIVGAELRDGSTSLHLFGAEDWYKQAQTPAPATPATAVAPQQR